MPCFAHHKLLKRELPYASINLVAADCFMASTTSVIFYRVSPVFGLVGVSQRRSDRVDLCSLRSLTKVLSIGPARTCRIPSRLKHGDHAMESLSNDAV